MKAEPLDVASSSTYLSPFGSEFWARRRHAFHLRSHPLPRPTNSIEVSALSPICHVYNLAIVSASVALLRESRSPCPDTCGGGPARKTVLSRLVRLPRHFPVHYLLCLATVCDTWPAPARSGWMSRWRSCWRCRRVTATSSVKGPQASDGRCA